MFDGKDNVQKILMVVIVALGLFLMVSYVRDSKKGKKFNLPKNCSDLKDAVSCSPGTNDMNGNTCVWTGQNSDDYGVGKCERLLGQDNPTDTDDDDDDDNDDDDDDETMFERLKNTIYKKATTLKNYLLELKRKVSSGELVTVENLLKVMALATSIIATYQIIKHKEELFAMVPTVVKNAFENIKKHIEDYTKIITDFSTRGVEAVSAKIDELKNIIGVGGDNFIDTKEVAITLVTALIALFLPDLATILKAFSIISFQNTEVNEGFSNYSNLDESFESFKNNDNLPSECYPKDVLSSGDLLPNDANSKWAQANPNGQGSLSDKNFLNAGYHVGVNTVGQSLRNANRQLRSDPPNPQVKVSPWMQTTIEPDVNRKPMEIGA